MVGKVVTKKLRNKFDFVSKLDEDSVLGVVRKAKNLKNCFAKLLSLRNSVKTFP